MLNLTQYIGVLFGWNVVRIKVVEFIAPHICSTLSQYSRAVIVTRRC